MEEDNEPSTPENSSQGGGGGEEEGEAGEQRASEYERERLLRIKENMARLEALGLLRPGSKPPRGASKGKKAGSRRRDDDDEYRPSDEDRNDADDDYEPLPTGSRQNLKPKGRKKISFSVAKTRKRPNRTGSMKEDALVDNDEASLQQAIALSLGSVTECSTIEAGGPSQDSGKTIRDAQLHGMKDKIKNQATFAKKKQRKPVSGSKGFDTCISFYILMFLLFNNKVFFVQNSSRAQLTEDEVVAFFFSFDEVGKGHIALRDLQRMAIAHDFSWTEMEIALMIHCFDSDKDGKGCVNATVPPMVQPSILDASLLVREQRTLSHVFLMDFLANLDKQRLIVFNIFSKYLLKLSAKFGRLSKDCVPVQHAARGAWKQLKWAWLSDLQLDT